MIDKPVYIHVMNIKIAEIDDLPKERCQNIDNDKVNVLFFNVLFE